MIWVAEYSASQDGFHVQPLIEALRANLDRALLKDSSDWILLAVGKEEEVRSIAELVRQGQARLQSVKLR